MKQNHIIIALLFGITSASIPAQAETFDEFGNSYGDKAPSKKAAAATKSEDLRFKESQFKACKDVTFISKSDYKKDELFWQEAVACGVDVQVLPDSGFFSGILRSLKSQNGFKQDKEQNEKFLRMVGAKAGEYLDYNLSVNGAIAACAKGDKETLAKLSAAAKNEEGKKLFDAANCEDTLKEVKDVAEEYGPKARVQYALTKKLQGVFGKLGNVIKFDMKTDLENSQLSAAEQSEVDSEYKKIMARVNAKNQEALKGLSATDIENGQDHGAYEAAKAEEFEKVSKEFMATLQKAPMLAFVAKPGRLTNEELASAMGQVVKNGVAERKKISDILAAADGTNGQNEKVKKMMEFMNYGPLLEDVLAQDPSLCGNATKLADALNNDKNKQMAVGMGAIVVGAVATGGLGSVLGAGALASSAASSAVALTLSHGAIYAPDYAKYQDAKQRGFSAAHTVDGKSTANKAIGDVKDFEEARDTLAMDFATLPLDFAGFGIYKGLATGGKSLALGAKDLSALAKMKIWDKPLAKAAAKNALTKSGLSELQALKVLADLKSADGVAAGRALTQLAKVLDIDTGEVKIMQNLYRTGIVPEVDTRASSRALARLRSIPAEQRAVTLNRVEDSLANLNTAKINAGNRDQVMETIIAGNQFGADPKRIASVVTDWDTGLDGLARTYDVARKKMDLPEVRGLASVEAKQEAAFGKALDELMEANPEFKALKSEDKLAAKNQMMGCGLKGK